MLIRPVRAAVAALALMLSSTACGNESTVPEAENEKSSDRAADGAGDLSSVPEPAVAEFTQQLAGTRLERFTDAFVASARPAASLTPDPSADATTVGRSRAGGRPDLPRGTEWPRSEGAPLTLVAQIDLAEAAALVPDSGLPKSGLMSFFYDREYEFEGGYPDTPDTWRVIHSPADSDLVTLPLPADADPEAHFEPVALTVTRELTFPAPESSAYEAITSVDDDSYWDALDALSTRGEDEYRSQLGGLPELLQGDVLDEFAEAGTDAGRAASTAADWRLLFTFASYDELDMVWDDMGVLYFGISRDDLAAGQWDKAWFVKQSA